VALAWLLCKHPHVLPIHGTRRLHYLEQNAAASSYQLSAEDIVKLDAIFSPERVAGERYAPAGMVGIE
jgi:aryl-alcohol dehydrogenase-like predicted oxidoreductase